MEEIEQDDTKNESKIGPGHVLIAAYDERTCSQLRDYLCEGSEAVLKRLYNKMLKNPTTIGEPSEIVSVDEESTGDDPVAENQRTTDFPSSRRRAAKTSGEVNNKRTGKGKKLAAKKTTQKDTVNSNSSEQTVKVFKGSRSNVILKPGDQEDKNKTEVSRQITLLTSRVVIIHPLTGCSDRYSLLRTLNEIEPRYVILYDAQMQFIRQLEVFRASRPGIPLRVYFLIYTGSVEEQKYLTTLRREKEAFEMLIKEKGTMVVPEEREGRSDAAMLLSRDASKASDAVNTRKAGGQITDDKATRKVIVDMREFRSELPSLIHRRGIDIEPVTLEVGDYILTPDMCVERKSISDLIGSLNNGRLYNQAVAMTRFYKKPVLLIEFDPNKSFSLQVKSSLSSEVSVNDISSKLTLLTLHFPKLRILWCHSPYATAELFDDLKANHPEPDASTAMAVGTDPTLPSSEITYSMGPQDFILKLPGINFKNYRFVMKNVASIEKLFKLSEGELTTILGNATNAKLLWEFIHKDNTTQAKASTTFKSKR